MYVIATSICPHFHFSVFCPSLLLNLLFESDSHSNEYLVGHTIASRNLFTHAEGHLAPNRAVKRLRHDASRGGDVRERRLAKFRQSVARFRLYRLRFLQENMRFAAFLKIYKISKLKFLKFSKIL